MNPNVVRAVEETADIVLVHNGEVCDARFSKCCGGITEKFSSCWESVDVPYLLSFRDADAAAEPFDASSEDVARCWIEGHDEAFCSSVDVRVLSQVLNGYDRETNDFYRWTVTYTAEELSQLIKKKSGIDFGHIEELVPLQRGSSGRIIRLKIVGSEKSLVVGKELEIRRWLSTSHLYSSAFIVDKKLDTDGVVQFVLRGAGWGHGVGLCQIGAAAMSDKGYDFRAILSHYYPNTELKNINTL
jgi:SpoIID/LytB domain protein